MKSYQTKASSNYDPLLGIFLEILKRKEEDLLLLRNRKIKRDRQEREDTRKLIKIIEDLLNGNN
jgi:hypothetical protein